MTPEATLALADRFFEALEAGDADTLSELYAPGATVWHNYDQVDQPREQNLAVLAWISRKVAGRRYEDIRRVVTPDGFVQQHVLRGTLADGSELEVPAMLRIYCADGHVTRVEEYLDTAQVAALMAPR